MWASAIVKFGVKSKCVVRKGYKKRCKPEASEANLTIADAHKVRVQKAQSTAMNKLMGQLGKPYRIVKFASLASGLQRFL